MTRADWANDYYSRWIALFPAVATAPEVTPTPAPTATAWPSYGPPPGTASVSAYSAADTSEWADAPRRRLPSVARIAIIAAITIAALWAVAGVVNLVAAATHSSTTAATTTTSNVPHATTSPPAAALPADLHGLSAREYPLMESVFESEDRTIPGLTAQGMTDDRLRSLTDTVVPEADRACAATAGLQNGFDNPTYKASFIAGYIKTSKVAPDKAAKVYEAIATYCLSS